MGDRTVSSSTPHLQYAPVREISFRPYIILHINLDRLPKNDAYITNLFTYIEICHCSQVIIYNMVFFCFLRAV